MKYKNLEELREQGDILLLKSNAKRQEQGYVLVCKRYKRLYSYGRTSVHREYCADCQADIWVADDDRFCCPGFPVVCEECGKNHELSMCFLPYDRPYPKMISSLAEKKIHYSIGVDVNRSWVILLNKTRNDPLGLEGLLGEEEYKRFAACAREMGLTGFELVRKVLHEFLSKDYLFLPFVKSTE